MKNNNYTNRYGYILIRSYHTQPHYYWLDRNKESMQGSYCWDEKTAIIWLEHKLTKQEKNVWNFNKKLQDLI